MLFDDRPPDGNKIEERKVMRDVILYMSMSLDGFIDSDREHPGMAIPEGAELKQWKLDRISKAGAHLMGRVTYQQMSSYWPQSDDEYAAPLRAALMRSCVIRRTGWPASSPTRRC